MLTVSAVAQNAVDTSMSDGFTAEFKTLPRTLAKDQYHIWTAPVHVKKKDALWLLPLGGATAALIATDSTVARHVQSHPNMQSTSSTISNAGLALALGAAGGTYLWGASTSDQHKRETGFLAMESVVDTLAVSEVMKQSFRRQRPLQNTNGPFLDDGSGFPSGHAMISFGIASVFAHEYPTVPVEVLAYGTATAVSVARVGALKHFPSDVAIGGTVGYLIGRYVYRAHHDKTLPGAEFGEFISEKRWGTAAAN
jgi:membrane-associated phospholipid phosphatase